MEERLPAPALAIMGVDELRWRCLTECKSAANDLRNLTFLSASRNAEAHRSSGQPAFVGCICGLGSAARSLHCRHDPSHLYLPRLQLLDREPAPLPNPLGYCWGDQGDEIQVKVGKVHQNF
jgi:hypothetical protein